MARGLVGAVMMAVCVAGSALGQGMTLALPGGQEVILPAGALSGVSDVAEPGLRLVLKEVTDQRCPSQYDCYWEGMIRAVILVNSDAHGAQYVVLCNMCDDGARSADVPGYVLTLDRLEPEHAVIERLDSQLGRAVLLADYTVVVTVAAVP